jgi:hypothetical protein
LQFQATEFKDYLRFLLYIEFFCCIYAFIMGKFAEAFIFLILTYGISCFNLQNKYALHSVLIGFWIIIILGCDATYFKELSKKMDYFGYAL